jgi:hypothetical protein
MFAPGNGARKPQPRASERPAAAAPARDTPRGNTRSERPPNPSPARNPRGAVPDARPEQAPQPSDEEGPPDANALIQRLRRQRQQREAEERSMSAEAGQRPTSRPSDDAAVEQRFVAGEKVFCLPYGDGEVRESRVEDGRELLTVNFPAHGDLAIDPAVSLVRKLEAAPPEDDDLL